MFTVKLTNMNSTFVTNITLKRPLPFLKCEVKTQFASLLLLRGSERMMCTQHAANQSCSSNLKRRTLHCVWRKFPQRGDYFVSRERGFFFSFKTMRLCVYYSPSPRRNRPRCYCEGEVRKVHCCIKPEFREALLWVTLPEQHSRWLGSKVNHE